MSILKDLLVAAVAVGVAVVFFYVIQITYHAKKIDPPCPVLVFQPTAQDILAKDDAAAKSFKEQFLNAYYAQHPKKPLISVKVPRVVRVLEEKDSLRQRIVLRNLERHARAHVIEQHLANGLTEVDWSKVDWNALLEELVKFLEVILPLLIHV